MKTKREVWEALRDKLETFNRLQENRETPIAVSAKLRGEIDVLVRELEAFEKAA
jgi:hypothetical protein